MADHETTLAVTGMNCGKCAARVEKALRSVAGVSDASVNLQAAEARVTATAETDVGALEAAVREAGYTCVRK